MHDPSHALQKALVARLAGQVAAVNGRVHDRVPQQVAFPYIGIGAAQVVPDDAECIDGARTIFTLHVWSRAVGAQETRQIANVMAQALTGWTPDLSADGFVFVDGRVSGTRSMDDPDGITTHGIVTFEAQTERA